MNKIILITFLFVLSTSCSTDEEDFNDLSRVEDYIMVVSVYVDSQKIGEPFQFEIIDYRTNSSEELTSHSNTFSGGITNEMVASSYKFDKYYAVKKFKKVGVTIKPIENVISYQFMLIKTTDYPIANIFTEKTSFDKETSIFYNFETEELSVN